jgi:ribonuclease HII
MFNKNKINLNTIEEEIYKNELEIKYIGGIDEVGRGCLAGPAVVGLVIFPKEYRNKEINDSKKLSPKKRKELYEVIIKNALYYSTISIDVSLIDKENIKNAVKIGMKKLCKECNDKFKMDGKIKFLIDYEKINEPGIITQSFIKGDEKVFSIAAASILAKVERDEYMDKLNKKYPHFSFDKHKGYGTLKHLEELEKYGILKFIHRESYKPVKKYMKD